jgi:hypothetical protein
VEIVATPEMIQRAAVAAPGLRNFMKDPDSFILESVTLWTRPGNNVDEQVICFGFRSKNGYGGYAHGSAMMRLTGSTDIISRGGTLLECNGGVSDASTDITAEVMAALAGPAPETPADKAKAAQRYADCLKLAVDNPQIACKPVIDDLKKNTK